MTDGYPDDYPLDSDNEQHVIHASFYVWADNEENARAKLWWDLRSQPHDYEVQGLPKDDGTFTVRADTRKIGLEGR